MVDKGPTYSFDVEWYDPIATMIKTYKLIYHTGINSVEMHDEKSNKLFLKPTKVDDLKLSDLYPGSSVTILSRTLRVIGFGDNFTRRALVGNSERCIAFVRPDAVCQAGKVLALLEEKGFRLVNLKMIYPTTEEVMELFEESINYTQSPQLLTELSQKVMIGVELMCNNACSLIREIVSTKRSGDESFVANAELFVTAKNPEMAARQAQKIFGSPGGPKFRGLPRLKGTTLAIVKPHAVAAGMLGTIWSEIQSRGFCVTAARLFRLSKLDAAEFLEVYKGVAHEYPEMLDQLASGPCVALEIANTGENTERDVQQGFREFVGPLDPEIARFLRPDTLRAKYGVDKVRNAIHCTDLPDDAEIEVNYFFRTMDK
ncbi:unnamed protein product [Calicophoron daubneyi]|uniref:DM10 domain-containing protein n=1 Tax=Calicophoron daubneyi TaxID=300641 RepID=A0AAV2TWG6_CALDB